MIRLDNITADAHQRHTIVFEESEIELVLRFHPTVSIWTFDATYKGTQVLGRKLSVGVPHMVSRNMPFDFLVSANAGTDLDPLRLDDFSIGRCTLYMLQADDMEVLRGAPVPL